jgi:hypothetical protein
MNKRTISALAAALVFSLLLVGLVAAMSSTNYAIDWDVMGGGGGPINSTSYSMNSTIGQGVIGSKSSTSYQLDSGYWPGGIIEYLIHLPIILKNFTP